MCGGAQLSLRMILVLKKKKRERTPAGKTQILTSLMLAERLRQVKGNRGSRESQKPATLKPKAAVPGHSGIMKMNLAPSFLGRVWQREYKDDYRAGFQICNG